MRYLFLLAFLLGTARLSVGQVTTLEYFLDTDPGFGHGTPVSISAGNDINQQLVIPLTALTAGYHVLHLRTKDAQGHWSLTARHTFFILPVVGTAITGAEYFIDTDPGKGQATALPAVNTADATFNFTVPLTSLPYGFHTLYVRTRDNENRWSLNQQKVFYVDHSSDTTKIASFQYYFQHGSTLSNTYSYSLPAPAAMADVNFSANLNELEPEKEYTMYIWAVTNTGQKSLVHQKQVKVCSGNVVKAGFDFITIGSEVSLIDSSSGAVKYYWDFGDGRIDSVSNPVHNYNTGGNYTIKQIVENFCNRDTVFKNANILSLQSIYPERAGNKGAITVTITGAGFTQNTIVKLVRNGLEINGIDRLLVNGGKEIRATFEFNNHETGSWDLQVTNGTNSQTKNSAFALGPLTFPKPWVDLTGRPNIRIGAAQEYTIKLGTSGNIDAHGIPLWLVVPHKSDVQFNFRVLGLINNPIPKDSIPLFFTTDTLFNNKTDSVDIYPFHIPVIPASFTLELPFKITTHQLGESNIQVFAFNPIYGSPPNPDYLDCISNVFNNSLAAAPTPQEYFNCDEKIKAFYTNTNNTLAKHPCAGVTEAALIEANGVVGECTFENFFHKQAFSNTHVILKSMGENAPGMMVSCGGDVVSLTGLMNTASLKEAIQKFINRIYQNKMKAAIKGIRDCNKEFGVTGIKSFTLKTVASLDPNEKVGPSGKKAGNHTRGQEPFNYSIYFENKSTATAPAQEVIIIDTLDKTRFDLSGFKLQSYGFGDSITMVPAGLQAFTGHTVLNRPGKPSITVRMDAKIDTATGIVKWRFLSLDPVTREILTDPLDGFLPPNKTGREGQGFVSYSIRPKETLSDGTLVNNKALIYFDNNAPIITNEFINTIDKVKPTSTVTPLPAQTTDTMFTVKWSGFDNGAGLRSYDVYYAINNGPFQLWLYDIMAIESVFTGKKDSLYKFYSIAKDYAGNIENGKTQAETSILITGKVTGIDDPQGNGFYFRQNYPNPATVYTLVEFNLPTPQHVRIVIRDIQGKEVGLITNKSFAAGTHKVKAAVYHLAAGMYLLEFNSKKFRKSIKLVKQ
jgi:PKD repeat protein